MLLELEFSKSRQKHVFKNFLIINKPYLKNANLFFFNYFSFIFAIKIITLNQFNAFKHSFRQNENKLIRIRKQRSFEKTDLFFSYIEIIEFESFSKARLKQKSESE